MKKYLALFSLLLIVAMNQAYGQNAITITGKVILADDTQPAVGVVAVLNAQDSTKLNQKGRAIATDLKGQFTLTSREAQNTVTFTYFGYKSKTIPVPSPKANSNVVNLGAITLEPSFNVIDDVQIVAKSAMMKVDGDTTQYNAAAFKTNPDATAEDLLKKLPGITTDENGKAQSEGQAITKVMVNGKEYFESNPTAALRSLPAEAVESMQLYDSQTDEAKFSGFDDGERIRTINITTKKGVMNSVFGKAYIGAGLFAPKAKVMDRSPRYASGVGVNVWNGNHRFTIIGQIDNVNGNGFDLGDVPVIRSGGGRGGRGAGGTDVSGFSTGTAGGIKESYMTAFNYNGMFSEKFKMSASYVYNGVNNNAISQSFTDYNNMNRQQSSENWTKAFQNSHSMDVRTEWNPNETNRINFNPSISYSNNFGASGSKSNIYLDDVLSNYSNNIYGTNLARLNGSANLWWQHSFGKTGRTLSLGGVVNGRRDIGSRTQNSEYTNLRTLTNLDPLYDTTLIRQIGSVLGDGYTFSGSATYAERLSKRSRLSLSYAVTYDRSLSDKQGWNFDDTLYNYSLIDTATTNYFNRNYTSHNLGLGYNYNYEKILNFSTKVDYQAARTNNDQRSPDPFRSTKREYPFQAVLPSFRLSYNPMKGQNLNLNYSTSSNFPSVNQLQEVLNSSNPLNVSTGDPNLKQSYSHNLQLRYSYASVEKNINFSLMGAGNLTGNYISQHRRFVTKDSTIYVNEVPFTIVRGGQFSSPVNLQGYQSARMFANFGFGLRDDNTKVNFLNLNFGLNYNYSRTPSIQDNESYMSFNNNVSGSIRATSNISENIEVNLSYRPSVSLNRAGRTGTFDRSFGHNVSGYVNWIFLKYFFINVDASWSNSYGTRSSYSRHFALLNAAIGAKFFKNRGGEIRLQCYDILDQNQSFFITSNENYNQTTSTNILKQYFMLSFTYKFDTRKNKNRNSDTPQTTPGQYRQNRMPMGGTSYGGGMGH